MAQRKSTPERNVDAEARAVEDGHHAFVMPGGWVRVVSDSIEGKWYEVLFVGHIDDLITFTCRPHGRRCYEEDHLYASSGRPGELPCKHAALAARKLEREGLACLDRYGRWTATAKARALRPPISLPANPLEGLPQ